MKFLFLNSIKNCSGYGVSNKSFSKTFSMSSISLFNITILLTKTSFIIFITCSKLILIWFNSFKLIALFCELSKFIIVFFAVSIKVKFFISFLIFNKLFFPNKYFFFDCKVFTSIFNPAFILISFSQSPSTWHSFISFGNSFIFEYSSCIGFIFNILIKW